MAAHASHATPPLGGIHLEGDPDCLRHALHVVGIHDEVVAHVARGAGEAAQHEHAIVVVPGGHELLGDEVHALVERGDQTQIGRAVELGYLCPIVVPVAV